MENKNFILKSFLQTKNFAKKLIKKILNKNKKTPIIIALIGEIGTGKTVFTKGVLEFFGIKNIQSPTFLIIKNYIPKKPKKNIKKIYHIDCYRIKKLKELEILDIKKILKEKNSLVLIEWAEKIKKFLPKNTIYVYFYHKDKTIRRISIENNI